MMRWFIRSAIIAIMIIAIALLLLYPNARAQEGVCRPFGQADIDRIVATGVPVDEIKGDEMRAVLSGLRELGPIDLEQEPTKMLVIIKDEKATIAILVNEGLCAIVRGPAALKDVLRKVRGEPA